MERLTARNEQGHAYYKKCFKEPCNGMEEENCGVCEYINETVCERLAEYEDLEITAEQVREIDKAYTELCAEFGKYTKLKQRLDNLFGGQLTLEDAVEGLESVLIEPDSPHPVNAKVLTHAEAAEWEEYQRLKEQGLIPPCNAGDTLYRINPGAKEPIIEMFVAQVLIKQLRKDCTVIRIETMDNRDLGENCYFSSDIGKRVFLSKEATEQALKEIEKQP